MEELLLRIEVGASIFLEKLLFPPISLEKKRRHSF